jgi:1-acyl-sn-glycerol-3-phosphate acyltransferase
VSADGLGNQPIADIAQPRPQDIGFLQYTSGSTGDPKGVVLTHANLMANVRADGAGLAVTPDDVFVSWLPLYHDMGLIGAWFGSLYHGIPLVLMSPLAFMSRPQRWLRAIHRFGGTLSAAPNFAYELCVRRVRDSELASLDLSRWRLSLNGAEAISPATLNAFSEKFAVCGLSPTTVLPVYGLAECAVGLAFSPLGREPLFDRIDREHLLKDGSARPASADTKDALTLVACGGALPGHQIRIVDTGGREAPERQQGRLQFCGPSATIGYYRAPQATAQLIQDGWHETGDLAYVAAGELYITGRSKDVIIRAGRNIHPVELEDAVSTLEGVRGGRVAAFGVPDERGGTERVVVVAETRLRDEERREMLRRDVNNLGIALIGGPVDEVVLAAPGTILRTSSGKVRRLACRDRYVDGQIGAKPLPAWVALGRLALAGVFPQCRRVTRVGLAWLWAVFAWFSLALASVVTFATIMAPMRLDTRWRFAHCVARGLVRWLGIELEVEDQRGEVCTQRRVFACNHQSYLDGFIIMASFREPVRFLAKAELVDVAPVRIMLERLGTRFVRRLDPAAAVADLVDVMAESEDVPPLFVFPEGTFKRMPGVLPFRLGAFVAAQDAGADVIPVAIRGTRSMLRSGSWFPRRGKARVVIGKPIPAGPLLEGEAASDWQRAVALRDTTRSFILGYCDEPDLAHESNRVKSQGR